MGPAATVTLSWEGRTFRSYSSLMVVQYTFAKCVETPDRLSVLQQHLDSVTEKSILHVYHLVARIDQW